MVRTATERDALLASGRSRTKKPFYRPRPLWLVPFAVVASIVRGMTLAPRVQVFTQLSCNAIYGHDGYGHTTMPFNTTSSLDNIPLIHTFSTLDPAGPHLYTDSLSYTLDTHPDYTLAPLPPLTLTFGEDSDDDDDEPDPRSAPSQKCLSDSAVQAGAARIQTVMTTTMGTLSALSTGWWGHFGERHGRD